MTEFSQAKFEQNI